jgi:hypothetical protein
MVQPLGWLDPSVALPDNATIAKALYERSILIHSQQPNNLEMKAICENFLQHGQPEAAMGYLNQAWESRFEHDRLQLLDGKEKADACDEAIAKAEQGGNLLRSTELLLNLEQTDRGQALVLSRHQELVECFYDHLLRLAKAFEKKIAIWRPRPVIAPCC